MHTFAEAIRHTVYVGYVGYRFVSPFFTPKDYCIVSIDLLSLCKSTQVPALLIYFKNSMICTVANCRQWTWEQPAAAA